MPSANLNTENRTLTLQGGIDYSKPETKDLATGLDLIFDTITEENYELKTDMTDHLMEDNTYMQDHIAIKPRVYTLRGLIGEKVYHAPTQVEYELPPEWLTAKLTPLKLFFPKVSGYIQSAINKFEAIRNKGFQFYHAGKNIINTAKNLKNFRFTKNLKALDFNFYLPQARGVIQTTSKKWDKELLQKKIIELLDGMRISRIPVTVQTGWGFYLEDNFYITDISVRQGNTYQLSELSVTIKQARFVNTKLATFNAGEYARLSVQNQKEENLGTVGTSKESQLYIRHLKGKEGFE